MFDSHSSSLPIFQPFHAIYTVYCIFINNKWRREKWKREKKGQKSHKIRVYYYYIDVDVILEGSEMLHSEKVSFFFYSFLCTYSICYILSVRVCVCVGSWYWNFEQLPCKKCDTFYVFSHVILPLVCLGSKMNQIRKGNPIIFLANAMEIP